MGPGLSPGKRALLGGAGLLALALFAVALALPRNAPGDLYRYVDEQGNLHITDRPPPAGQGKGLRVYRSIETEPEPSPKESDRGVHVVPFMRVTNSSGGVTGMAVEVTMTRGFRTITRPFVVDTGASVTVVTLEDVMELGVAQEDVTGSSIGVVPGGGRVLAHHVTLDEMTLGGLRVLGHSVAVIKGGSMRLLGIDVLGNFDLEVKNDQGVIVLKEK